MKKAFLLIGILTLFFSCSDDDNDVIEGGETETPVLRILQVNTTTDQVWLSNFGTETIDVADYWLCLGPGTYEKVSDATSSSTTIAPGENIMVSYDVNAIADGLSIFSTNTFTSSDPSILVDYVQWGAADQARVDQAVTAGRWDDASNFVAVGESYTFTGETTDFGASFYSTVAGEAILRILQVDASLDQVWLSNLGTATIDAATYWLCLGPGTYEQVSDATTGSTIIAPGENIMLSYDVNETADGLSIFSTNTFGSSDPSILIDYVQWGAADQARVGQAVTAGRWDDATNFVSGGPVYTFTGEATEFGVTFW